MPADLTREEIAAGVRLEGWTWSRPWVSLPDERGRVWRRNWCPGDSGFGWTQVAGPRLRSPRPTFDAVDVSDPGVAGCALDLLGGPAMHAPYLSGDPAVWHWWDGTDWRDAPNLGTACFRAALARGRWG